MTGDRPVRPALMQPLTAAADLTDRVDGKLHIATVAWTAACRPRTVNLDRRTTWPAERPSAVMQCHRPGCRAHWPEGA